ncbi:hypothetical protein Vau01_014600 [Virgisporangium aurantiacum]|uniref:Uncharacterized protein n=1 Tax=Virgisporangium aurantiacum TaxID=175570 RepID=A0A8J3YXR7_9ACTN|nr:hypothetical protein Vau01_014600 [Virgisporangium aurantiacum]
MAVGIPRRVLPVPAQRESFTLTAFLKKMVERTFAQRLRRRWRSGPVRDPSGDTSSRTQHPARVRFPRQAHQTLGLSTDGRAMVTERDHRDANRTVTGNGQPTHQE